MKNNLTLFDIVKWQPPEGVSRIWMVSMWGLGKSGITLSDETLDFRSDGAKTQGTDVQWVRLTAVGHSVPEVAVDVERVYAEGQILNSSAKGFNDETHDDDDDEGF